MNEKSTKVIIPTTPGNKSKINLGVEFTNTRNSGADSVPVNRASDRNMPENIGSILDLRESDLELISNIIARVKYVIIEESNCPYKISETAHKFQDEIDLMMVEISDVCTGLQSLPSNWTMSASGVIDPEKTGLEAITIDLHYLGLDKGIKVIPKYSDILVSNRDALLAELELSASDDQRINAVNKLQSYDRAMNKFSSAMERFFTVCLKNNVSPFNEAISSAERLADELNKASQFNSIDRLSATDIDLLAGGSQNFAAFLAKVKQVMPLPLNLSIVETAYDKVRTELSKTIRIHNEIEVGLRSKPISNEQLSSAAERLRGQNIMSTLQPTNKPKSDLQLKVEKEEKESDTILLR